MPEAGGSVHGTGHGGAVITAGGALPISDIAVLESNYVFPVSENKSSLSSFPYLFSYHLLTMMTC